MKINHANVEEILFANKEIWSKIPNCRSHYDHWRMVRFFPGMSSEIKKIGIDLLNALGCQEISALEKHFGEEIIIEGVDLRLIDEHTVESEEWLEVSPSFTEAFAYRGKDGCVVNFWR